MRSEEYPEVTAKSLYFQQFIRNGWLMGGWQLEGSLPISFCRAGTLDTTLIVTYELTMSSEKFCSALDNCCRGCEKHGVGWGDTQEKM